MDSNSFENIKRAVNEQSFKDEKLDALKSTLACSYGYLSADQVAEIVPEFTFDDDKVKAVEICAPRMYSITCEQAASIMGVISFDKSKIKALEAIACHITDNNLSAFDSVLDFSSDKDRAREILMNRPHSGPQPGFPPQAGAYPSVGPPPGGFPGMAPQHGGYPAQAPYPGASPYPGQSPYPGAGPYGGMCPPYGQPVPGAAPPQYATGTVPPPTGFPGGAMMGPMSHGPQYPPPGGYPQPGYPYQPGDAGQ
ncbi:uncharacterized protein LOC144654655 [Oculina patagonica]